jgi:hypothetical protein
MDKIVVVNHSTVLSDEQVQNVIPALQAQVHEDFAPAWGIDADVEFASSVLSGTWMLEILDTTDVPDAGGYHTDDQGRISGKVFARDAIEAGEAWTVDASHELLEMLADPTAGTDPSQYIDLTGHYAGLQCLREVCDAVEDDALGYSRPGVDGRPVQLSDFVLPAYFGEVNQAGTGPDFKGRMHDGTEAPALLHNGYLGIYDPATQQWSQVSDFALLTRRHHRSARRVSWGISRRTP